MNLNIQGYATLTSRHLWVCMATRSSQFICSYYQSMHAHLIHVFFSDIWCLAYYKLPYTLKRSLYGSITYHFRRDGYEGSMAKCEHVNSLYLLSTTAITSPCPARWRSQAGEVVRSFPTNYPLLPRIGTDSRRVLTWNLATRLIVQHVIITCPLLRTWQWLSIQ